MKIAPLEAVQNLRVEGKAAACGVSKSSRRRLPCAAWPLVQGMMLMHRANLREAKLTTWARTHNARAKLRDSFWRDDSDNSTESVARPTSSRFSDYALGPPPALDHQNCFSISYPALVQLRPYYSL